ncbi:hypothetical protein [Siccirubricoccus phaeus]|uniref:hypothetical protein n=1 Tax=Siccirubricoccus phaeus TaxID=2595053 RepID=UPI0011F27A77|nr:hypothetical protein [Siccirubricoccus phaeus]
MTDAELIALMRERDMLPDDGNEATLAELVAQCPCREVIRFGPGPVVRVSALFDPDTPKPEVRPDATALILDQSIAEARAAGGAVLVLTTGPNWMAEVLAYVARNGEVVVGRA